MLCVEELRRRLESRSHLSGSLPRVPKDFRPRTPVTPKSQMEREIPGAEAEMWVEKGLWTHPVCLLSTHSLAAWGSLVPLCLPLNDVAFLVRPPQPSALCCLWFCLGPQMFLIVPVGITQPCHMVTCILSLSFFAA